MAENMRGLNFLLEGKVNEWLAGRFGEPVGARNRAVIFHAEGGKVAGIVHERGDAQPKTVERGHHLFRRRFTREVHPDAVEPFTPRDGLCDIFIAARSENDRTTLSMDDLGKLKEHLTQEFAQRSNPYYFAAVLNEHDRQTAQPILHSRHGLFLSDTAFHWKEDPVPDEEVLRADRSVRIVMAQLLQNEQETMGYLISGMKNPGRERPPAEAAASPGQRPISKAKETTWT